MYYENITIHQRESSVEKDGGTFDCHMMTKKGIDHGTSMFREMMKIQFSHNRIGNDDGKKND
jgi:hypothetical protein